MIRSGINYEQHTSDRRETERRKINVIQPFNGNQKSHC